MPSFAGLPISGKGGFAAISYFYPSNTATTANTLTLTASDWMVVDNSEYVVNANAIVDDVTTSYSGGYTEGLGGNVDVQGISITLPEDSPSSVEAGVLTFGQKYNLWLKRGAQSAFDLVLGCIFRGMSKSNDNAGGTSRRVTIEFEKGAYSGSLASTASITYKNHVWAGSSCGAYLASVGRTA